MFTISCIFTIKLINNMTIDSPLPSQKKWMIVNEVLQTSFKIELVIYLEFLFDFKNLQDSIIVIHKAAIRGNNPVSQGVLFSIWGSVLENQGFIMWIRKLHYQTLMWRKFIAKKVNVLLLLLSCIWYEDNFFFMKMIKFDFLISILFCEKNPADLGKRNFSN